MLLANPSHKTVVDIRIARSYPSLIFIILDIDMSSKQTLSEPANKPKPPFTNLHMRLSSARQGLAVGGLDARRPRQALAWSFSTA